MDTSTKEVRNKTSFWLPVSPFLKVDFPGLGVASDSSLLLVRELDEFGIECAYSKNIMDKRGEERAVAAPGSTAADPLQSLGRVRRCEKIWDRGAALPSRLPWFETEVLS